MGVVYYVVCNRLDEHYFWELQGLQIQFFFGVARFAVSKFIQLSWAITEMQYVLNLERLRGIQLRTFENGLPAF
jgi:hypothetical protein